jgi:hypothetical protein
MGCTVRLLHGDTISKSPDAEMDFLNSSDLRCGTLKGGKGGSLFRAASPGHVVIFNTGKYLLRQKHTRKERISKYTVAEEGQFF